MLILAVTLQELTKISMAKTNYTFEKRQKELAKQKKQADKLLKKNASKEEQPQDELSQNELTESPAGENTVAQ